MDSLLGSNEYLIGVDVGGTKISACLVDTHGEIITSVWGRTNVTNPESTLDSIANNVNLLISKANLSRKEIKAIGFGIPGLVDSASGMGIASVNLGWNNVPVRAELEKRLGIKCVIDNDVRAGAKGELLFGAAKGMKNIVYLNIGTGISAVIILNGEFFIGMRGLAGEIGHAVLVPEGPLCKCGGHGCFEAVASGPGIVERARRKILDGQSSVLAPKGLTDDNSITLAQVYAAARQKDALAMTTLDEIARMVANAIQYLLLAYDPEILVIGGSVLLKGSILFEKIEDYLSKLKGESWVFAKIYSREVVRVSTLGNNAGVLGAAALVSSP